MTEQEKFNKFSWDDNKVIDFVNWYLKVHRIDCIGRYNLENKTLIESFKRGGDLLINGI